MRSYNGMTVLVTGASSGIGRAAAVDLAERGAHLILTARSEQALETLAAELKARSKVAVTPIAMDLAKPGAAQRLMDAVAAAGLSVDVLINNAGFGKWGDLLSIEADANAEMIQLNITALVELTRLCLPTMLARKTGGVINVASTAAFAPLPYAAVYSASKTFVLYFSEAIWGECRGRGVHVLALCPGGTATNFAAVASESAALGGKRPGMDSAEGVAKQGLDAFLARKTYLITAKSNRNLAWLPRLLTRKQLVISAGARWKKVVDRVAAMKAAA
jgi:short-subunit dehydrogenase